MYYMMIIVISLSLIGLFTLFFSKKIFTPIEIITYYIVILEISMQFFSVIVYSLEMITPSKQLAVYWILNARTFIMVPSLTIWLLSYYFLQSTPFYRKGLLTLGWLFSLSTIDFLFNRIGFITFKRWNFGYSLIEWLIVLFGSFCFILFFRKLLRKKVYS
jgi:hypothetical protein